MKKESNSKQDISNISKQDMLKLFNEAFVNAPTLVNDIKVKAQKQVNEITTWKSLKYIFVNPHIKSTKETADKWMAEADKLFEEARYSKDGQFNAHGCKKFLETVCAVKIVYNDAKNVYTNQGQKFPKEYESKLQDCDGFVSEIYKGLSENNYVEDTGDLGAFCAELSQSENVKFSGDVDDYTKYASEYSKFGSDS
jgi:hypothetical protein